MGMLCECGREIADIRFSEYYRGLETVSVNGRVCCSSFEGEYDTPSDAAGQITMAKRHSAKAYDRAHDPNTIWHAESLPDGF